MLWRAVMITAVFLAAGAVLYTFESTRYGWGTPAEPGPGLYPFLVGILLLAGSLGCGMEALLHHPQEKIDWPKGQPRLRILTMLTASVGYVVSLPYLGHFVAGSLVVFVVLHVMGMKHLFLKLGLSIAMGLASYYLFAVVLGVPIPRGMGVG